MAITEWAGSLSAEKRGKQMEERINGQEYPGTYGEESRLYEERTRGNQNPYGQQYGSGQNPYGQQYGSGPNPYGGQNPFYGPNPYMPQQQPLHGPVTDVFCNILLVLMPLQIILGFFSMHEMVSRVRYQYFFSGHHVDVFSGAGGSLLVLLGYGLSVAHIVFIILDIVKVHQQNYKITGLILFAIFLAPGYYIWRAYILGRKKTFPIIYTVIYSLLLLAYMVYTFHLIFNMVMAIMYFY